MLQILGDYLRATKRHWLNRVNSIEYIPPPPSLSPFLSLVPTHRGISNKTSRKKKIIISQKNRFIYPAASLIWAVDHCWRIGYEGEDWFHNPATRWAPITKPITSPLSHTHTKKRRKNKRETSAIFVRIGQRHGTTRFRSEQETSGGHFKIPRQYLRMKSRCWGFFFRNSSEERKAEDCQVNADSRHRKRFEMDLLLNERFPPPDEEDGEGEEEDDNETARRSHGDVNRPSVGHHGFRLSHRNFIWCIQSIINEISNKGYSCYSSISWFFSNSIFSLIGLIAVKALQSISNLKIKDVWFEWIPRPSRAPQLIW